MIRKSLTFLALISCFISMGQGEHYSEAEVIQSQRMTSSRIMIGLQNMEVDSILPYFDDSIKGLHSKLKKSVVEIDHFKNSTRFSEVVVFDKDHHIFRCRYSDETRPRFQIDLYFQTNNPNSKVIDIEIKTNRALKKEFKRRMKELDLPPPPPKPNKGY